MYLGKPTRRMNAIFAVLSLLLSCLAFYSWATFEGIPPRSDLESATGQVSWVQNGKYGIKFGLAGVPKSFDYASKGNAMGLVHDTLSRSDHPRDHRALRSEQSRWTHLLKRYRLRRL